VTRDEIHEKIRRIIFEQLKANEREIVRCLEDVKPGSRLMTDLGADSLDVVEIVTSVEEEFDLLIPDELVEQIATLGEAVDYIHSEL